MLRAIRIRPGRPVRALRGHPWAFLGEVEFVGEPPVDGDCVELTDLKGRCLGAGLWNGKSQIAWRRYSRRPITLDGPLLEELVTASSTVAEVSRFAVSSGPRPIASRAWWSTAITTSSQSKP